MQTLASFATYLDKTLFLKAQSPNRPFTSTSLYSADFSSLPPPSLLNITLSSIEQHYGCLTMVRQAHNSQTPSKPNQPAVCETACR